MHFQAAKELTGEGFHHALLAVHGALKFVGRELQ
jgi:hypothetical protein